MLVKKWSPLPSPAFPARPARVVPGVARVQRKLQKNIPRTDSDSGRKHFYRVFSPFLPQKKRVSRFLVPGPRPSLPRRAPGGRFREGEDFASSDPPPTSLPFLHGAHRFSPPGAKFSQSNRVISKVKFPRIRKAFCNQKSFF